MPGPFGKDISYAEKIGGPARKHFNYRRIVAIIVNLVSSYFVFFVQCSLLPKFCVFLISMATLYMVFLEEPNENPQTKSRSEYKTERRKDDGTNTSFFSAIVFIVLFVFFQTASDNFLNINEPTLAVIVAFVVGWLILMYAYFEHSANGKKKWKSRL